MDRKEQLLQMIIKKFVHSVTAKTRQAGFVVLIATVSWRNCVALQENDARNMSSPT